jgi:PAS domain S-box-containing protein
MRRLNPAPKPNVFWFFFLKKNRFFLDLSPVWTNQPKVGIHAREKMPDTPHPLEALFPGDSALSQLMRAHDWAATPLGDPQHWPEALLIPLRMMLTSRFEMWLGWGPDLAFFYNDAYRPTLGVKHPAALGRPVAEVWREIYAEVADRFRAVLQDGASTWDKALMLLLERRGYPEESYHTFSYSPLVGASGRPEGLMCVVTEETERVISERRLGTLRNLAGALIGALSVDAVLARVQFALEQNRKDFPFYLIYLRDDDGVWHVHHGSAAVERLTGAAWPFASLSEAGGSAGVTVSLAGLEDLPCGAWTMPPARALMLPIARAGSERPIGALVLGLNPYRPHDPDLPGFGLLIAGQIAGALGNVEALESERRRADRVWLNSRDLMVVVGRDGLVRAVSPSWTHTLGHTAEEVVGQPFLDFVHPDDAAASAQALVDAALRRDLTPFENRLVSKLGEARWLSWNTTMETGGGEAGGEDGLVYAYGRDITESRAQAEALRAVEAALRQSQKMEAVGQLTGGLAHDFNNLLTGISGSLELLQSRLAQGRHGELDRYASAAQGAARRAASLTHRLLAFSRQQTLDPKATNVNRLVSGMEELIRRTMGPPIKVEVAQAAGLWTTLLDPHQLENALLNLCINARDAMPQGGNLTIETANVWLDDRASRERDLPPGQYISLCVTDTGTGMTPEVVSRAIDPFFTTKPLGQGTGLGLSMVYGFVRQSGGQLRIYSELGSGTTMCLYLPRHHGEAETLDEAGDAAASPEAAAGETVLVVDDEPTVRMLVTEVLQDLGYIALEAPDAAVGLSILQSPARIDLLVSDVGLPGGMNGRQMADAARLARPDLKVLFITGYAENAVIGNGQLEPGMHVLTKPFAVDTLASRLKSLLDE